eukprot:2284448-Ditylum_brightwellii.AAC.1
MAIVAVLGFLVVKPTPEPAPKLHLLKKSTIENDNDDNSNDIFDDDMGEQEKEANQRGTGNRFVANEAEGAVVATPKLLANITKTMGMEAIDLGKRVIYHKTHHDAYSGGINNLYH